MHPSVSQLRKFRKAKVFVVSDRKRGPFGIFGILQRSLDAPRDDVTLVIKRNQEGLQRFRTQLLGSLTEGSRNSSDRWPAPRARVAVSSSVPKFLQEAARMCVPHEPQADTIA